MFDWNKALSMDAYEFEIKDVDKEITPQFVKKLRNELKLSQKMFATILGVSEKTIEKWEQGVVEVKRTASRLLYILDKHPDLLDTFYTVKREDEVVIYRECYTIKPIKVKKADEQNGIESIKYIPEKGEDKLVLLEPRGNEKSSKMVTRYI